MKPLHVRIESAAQRVYDLRDSCPVFDEETWKILDSAATRLSKLSAKVRKKHAQYYKDARAIREGEVSR